MTHLSLSTEGVIAGVLAIIAAAAVAFRVRSEREALPPEPTTGATQGGGGTAPAPGVPPVAIVLMVLAPILGGLYAVTHSGPEHHIRFQPGQYRHIPFTSGKALSMAMAAVETAPDTQSLDAAIAVVQNMAAKGDAEAAFRLGRFYHMESTEPDYASALKYYRMAVDQNHAWATNNIGLLYLDGLGVARNPAMASSYFRRAAALGSSWGYLNLEDLSLRDGGAPAGGGDAIAWLELGGHNNCTACLIEEAAIYHDGAYGVGADASRTVALLEKASALGDDQARLLLAELRIVGDGVPQSSKAALETLKTLSDDGDADATVLLGELSADDKIRDYLFDSALGGVQNRPADLTDAFPQDTAISVRDWERANQQGSCQSWIDLSSLFDRGIGVGVDTQKATGYVERAVRCDPTNSFYAWKLGARFYDAKGVDRDCQRAQRLFSQALAYGYADAAVNLGYIYDKGCAPIQRDDARAFQIYLLGAKQGVALCQNNVGVMIKHGRAVPAADLARGYGWIKLAALHGDALARANLQDPVYTPDIRALGLVQLADIQRRLLMVPSDPRAIARDPWY